MRTQADPRGDNHFARVIQPEMEAMRRKWIDKARELAVEIAEKHGTVTADDIHEAHPLPEGIEPRTMGAVFHDPRFQLCHYTPGRRSVRAIGAYGLTGKSRPDPYARITELERIVAEQQRTIRALEMRS